MKKNYYYKVWQIICDQSGYSEAYISGVSFSNYKDAKKYFNSIKKDVAAYSYLKPNGYLETFISKELKNKESYYDYFYFAGFLDYFKYVY